MMKCPKCGSEGKNILWLNKFPAIAYECKNVMIDGRLEGGQSRKCKDRQIAALQARIEKLERVRKAAKALRDCPDFFDSPEWDKRWEILSEALAAAEEDE